MDINTLVDDILNESESEKIELFTVISEPEGFARSVDMIKNYDTPREKGVFLCEKARAVLPEDVIQKVFGSYRVLNEKDLISSGRLKQAVHKVIVPNCPEHLAELIARREAVGSVSSLLKAAIDSGIPVEVAEKKSSSPIPEDVKQKLSDLGCLMLKDACLAAGHSESYCSAHPEWEVLDELIHHFSEFCELEDGADCIQCEKCKVRGF